MMNKDDWVDRQYYNNGRLWYEIPYHKGYYHGTEKWWWGNGRLRYKCQRYKGQPHGISTGWYKNGQLNYKTYFLYGDPVSKEEYRRHELILKLSGLNLSQ